MKKTVYLSAFWVSILLFLMSSTFLGRDLDLLKEKVFNVQPGQLLILKTDAGDVIMKAWDKNELMVKIYGDKDAERKMEFSFNQDENSVTVIGEKEGGKLWGWFSSIDLKYEILVPFEFNLDVKTAGGDLSAKNITGEFELKTSGGDIYMKNSAGKLVAGTSGGDIVLADYSGDAELSTSGGDIDVKGENGDVYANTSGGDISIIASNGAIIGKTSGGDIRLSYEGENKGIELKTSGGDIDVKLPSNINADVDIRTSGGEINNQFSNNRMAKITKSTLQGNFNGGGDALICKTSGGDITILER